MSFINWIQETKERFHENPSHVAMKGSLQELWVGAITRGIGCVREDEGEPIWNREFDVCCVVDSCRWDLFAEVCANGDYEYLPESPSKLRSVGSMSPEWITRTFAPEYEQRTQRTAYLTANTFSGNEAGDWPALPLEEPQLRYLDEAWRTHWKDDIEGGISVVPPEILTDKAIDVWRRNESLGVDQVVIHYMQPHTPFRSIPGQFPTYSDEEPDESTDVKVHKEIWKRCRDGEIEPDVLWSAYRDNLEWVLDSIELLINNCDGTVAITSDHGNGFGDWGVWGHPPGNPLDVVRNVPWMTIDTSDSGSYEPAKLGKDREAKADSDVDVRAQLDALGYR